MIIFSLHLLMLKIFIIQNSKNLVGKIFFFPALEKATSMVG